MPRPADQRTKTRRRSPFVYRSLCEARLVIDATTVCVRARLRRRQARFSRLGIFPFLVTAVTVYGYRQERAAKNMAQGTVWGLAQIVCAIGALALIALPAKY